MICQSSWRYDAPTKAAKKSSVIEPEASGAFGFSGSRSGPRSVLVWSTPTSNAQLSFHLKPCVRPKFAKVRGPYSVACVLMLDLTCVRSHGRVRMPKRVMSDVELVAFGMFVFGEQRGVARELVVDAEDAARRIVDARVLAAERSIVRAAQRHAAVPDIDAAGDERLVGDALVAARVFIGHVAQRRRRRCSRACCMRTSALASRRVASLASTCWCCTSPDDHERFGELVARIDAGAARTGVGGELLADAEAVSGLARPGARFEMLGGVFAFDQPGRRGIGPQRIVRLRLRDFGAHLGLVATRAT